MRRVEKHIIKKNHCNWKIIDNLCWLSKQLYNKANYCVRQCFFETSKEVENGEREKSEWLRLYQLDKLAKEQMWEEYRNLPAQTSQQILMLLEKNWKSFFRSIKAWKKDKSKFNNLPKPPRYKNKSNGRYVVIFTKQQIRIKDNQIHFPKRTCLKPMQTMISNICQVRFVPKSCYYVMEVVYEKNNIENVEADSNFYLGIDIGLNNLATLTSNKQGFKPILVNGRPIKSINQYFNKQRARFMSYVKDRGISNRIKKLTLKRNCKIDDYLHKASRYIVEVCIKNGIGKIVIGKNDNWKNCVNIGRKNNQNFVFIPFLSFIEKIQYKAEEFGIEVFCVEESYTSKCSFLDLEPIKKHENYKGRRISRGLFRSAIGRKINADVNGSLNILRKAVPNLFRDGIEGVGLHPIKVSF